MARKKQYEEKQIHGTVELPVGFHKMTYSAGTDVIFYLHWHQEFELLVVTDGAILFTIEDREYSLGQGEGVFINSNLLHSARAVDGRPCSFFAVDFHYQLFDEDIHSRFARRYLKPVLDGKVIFPEFISDRRADECIRPEFLDGRNKPHNAPVRQLFRDSGICWQGELLRLLRRLEQCPEHNTRPYELVIRSSIMEIWNLLECQSVRVHHREEERVSGRMEPVISYMQENYSYEITLTELAQLLPMSEGQFCRVFKQNMKMSPMQYLMRYRILQSCRLLLDTDKKIGEIANLSGFNNISYFNKVFLQTIGCTPKEYRNNSNY